MWIPIESYVSWMDSYEFIGIWIHTIHELMVQPIHFITHMTTKVPLEANFTRTRWPTSLSTHRDSLQGSCHLRITQAGLVETAFESQEILGNLSREIPG